jgi:uncharacterized protein YdeI (YjbR/CyaY-like superfamily)
MAPAGVRVVEAAQTNGAWTVYHEIDDLAIPDGLPSVLAGDESARTTFANFPVSSR